MALQALLALGGWSCAGTLFAEPNIAARVPGTPEDLSGALADPEPLFAAPTRLDRIGRVMTHVMVNGKGPFRFVIDTGASRSTLAPHLARALNLQNSGRNVILNGVTGAAEVPTVAVDSLEIGALRFEKQNLPVIFTSIMGNADGILGVAGFQDQRIDVDFKRDRVSVLESNGRRPNFSLVTARATRNANGLMIVEVRVGRRIRTKAVIDTGAERTLGNLALQDAMNKNRRKKRAPVSAVVHGATPDITDGDVQEIREATIGDMTLSNLEVIFADFHVFKLWGLDKEPALLIGMDMLGVLDRLVIDYRRNEVSMYGQQSSSRLVGR
jgi:predicted aspartyl protease